MIDLKIIRLSTSRVGVYLTNQDLEKFNISVVEKQFPQAIDLHKFLQEVMQIVHIETDFNPYIGGQVIVEASPIREGLVLMMSKIADIKKHKLTKNEFKRVKQIKAYQDIDINKEIITNDMINEIIGINSLQNGDKVINEHISMKGCIVFLFDSFKEFEKSVELIPKSLYNKCILYRMKKEYALKILIIPGRCICNRLSEFSKKCIYNNIIADDIQESWECIATENQFAKLVQTLHKNIM